MYITETLAVVTSPHPDVQFLPQQLYVQIPHTHPQQLSATMASSTTNLSTAPFNFYLARDSTRYPFHPNYTYESWFKPQKDMVVITGDNNALYLTPFMMNSLGSIT